MLGAIDPADEGSVKLKEQETQKDKLKVSVDRHRYTQTLGWSREQKGHQNTPALTARRDLFGGCQSKYHRAET